MKLKMRKTACNIVLAIVGLTVVNSTFVILSGICANVGLKFFSPPSPIRKPLCYTKAYFLK